MRFPVLVNSPLFKGLSDSEIEAMLDDVNYRVILPCRGSGRPCR
ncbi:MAG: hypothetical protein R2758_17165 [Bacteroidales bacterium]